MKLNNMISELHVARQKERAVKTDFKSSLSGLREEMIDRMKTNEDMFDTEMDAFRKKIEGLSGQVSAWKDFQKSMSRVPGKKEDYDMGSTIEDMSRRLSSSREEMKQFKEYVIGYMNNLVSTYEGKMKSIKDEIKARA